MAAGVEPPMDIETYKAIWISKGYRLIELGTPEPEHIISKSLFIKVWDAIRKNNHAEIIRLKDENPDLTIYSKALFGIFIDSSDVDYGSLPYYGDKEGYVSILRVFSCQTINQSIAGSGMWNTTYETHKLLFDLGLIERNDPRIIFELLRREYLLEEKETAYEFLSSFMDLESIRKTFFFYFPNSKYHEGDPEFEFYSWKVLISKKYSTYQYQMPPENVGEVDLESLHNVLRRNAVVQMLDNLLLKGSDFFGYKNFVFQKPDCEDDDEDDDEDNDDNDDGDEDDDDDWDFVQEEQDEHEDDDEDDDEDDYEDGDGEVDYVDFDLDDDEQVEIVEEILKK